MFATHVNSVAIKQQNIKTEETQGQNMNVFDTLAFTKARQKCSTVYG